MLGIAFFHDHGFSGFKNNYSENTCTGTCCFVIPRLKEDQIVQVVFNLLLFSTISSSRKQRSGFSSGSQSEASNVYMNNPSKSWGFCAVLFTLEGQKNPKSAVNIIESRYLNSSFSNRRFDFLHQGV